MTGAAYGPEIRARAVALGLQGMSQLDVAVELEMDPTTVAKFWRLGGLPPSQSRQPQETDWPSDQSDRLCVLWAEGHSTAEIGRLLGVSKNAVIGRVRRLALEPRPSPIVRTTTEEHRMTKPKRIVMTAEERRVRLAEQQRAYDQKRMARKLAARKAERAAKITPPEQAAPRLVVAQPIVPAVRRVTPVAESAPCRATPVAPLRLARVTECSWPIGEPRKKGFRFCEAESEPRKPYCAAHSALAFVKVRDRHEAATP